MMLRKLAARNSAAMFYVENVLIDFEASAGTESNVHKASMHAQNTVLFIGPGNV